MSGADLELDDVPVAQAVPPRADEAAALLDRAIKAGCQQPEVAYLLGLAYKRLGKTAEARAAFRRITPSDANVLLQLGLLSLEERQLAQAEEEFARSLELDAGSFEACHNLLMTRLSLGRIEDCLQILPRALELAPPEERPSLSLLQALLQAGRQSPAANGEESAVTSLRDMSPEQEHVLLRVVRSLGDVDVVLGQLKALRAARPQSEPVQQAYVEAVLVKGKALFDRCDWLEAERFLTPLARDRSGLQVAAKTFQAAYYNLLGCCCCLNQDPESGLRYFQSAVKLAPNDARLQQNLALAYQWQNNLSKADPHWNRYFDLLDRRLPAPPGQADYHDRLAFEGLVRLANLYFERERSSEAIDYMERAQRLRPNDAEILDRLFQLYQHAKHRPEARRTLGRLRELRPNEPQYELYELDLIEVKNLGDIDRMLTEIDRIRQRHPGDVRVEDRAVAMVGNVIPLMGNLCDQLTDQMNRVLDQVRHLPNYQINWSAVHDVMHDLLREFQKLRRITNKCLPLVRSEEHRRIVRDLADHIDRRMEVCREMGDRR